VIGRRSKILPFIFYLLLLVEYMKRIKRIVIFTLFMDILWLTIVIPAYPNLVEYFHTDYFMISLGVTLFALFWLFASPILWALSDRYWRRPILLISVFFSFVSYAIIAVSWNIYIYLLARVFTGLASGNVWAIQSVLSDISEDHKERTANFWFFGAIFWIWFIIGPAIGGRLLWYGVKVPFIISGVLAFLNLVFIFRWVPETNKLLDKAKKVGVNVLRIFKDMFVSNERKYYLVFFVVNLAIMIYQMSFILFLNSRFGIWGEKSGYIMALFGLIMAINQWLFLPKFWLKKFTNKKLISISLFGMVACYLGAFLFGSLYPVIGFIALSSVFQGIFRPVFQNMMLGNRQDVGVLNGNVSALANLANIFWPILGGYLIDIDISPFGIVAVLILLAYVYAKKYLTTQVA